MTEPQNSQAASKKEEHPKDTAREWTETIVFVVCLVLLLKAFVAEAFVIPTGSMADTRFGNHYACECPQCQTRFAVGEGRDGDRPAKPPSHVRCPNCSFSVAIGPLQGGDKVLVFKSRYDFYGRPTPEANRHDTIVFKYPGQPLWLVNKNRAEQADGASYKDSDERHQGPQEKYAAYNYIKRVWGFPGERLAIWLGDVYLRDGPGEKANLSIIRKRPDIMLDMRRPVHINDNQSPELQKVGFPPRWDDGERHLARRDHRALPADPDLWTIGEEDGKPLLSVNAGGRTRWLRYEHLVPSEWREPEQVRAELAAGNVLPQLITSQLAYNDSPLRHSEAHWVPDLLLECQAEVQDGKGLLILELVNGLDRHRAVFDVQHGTCTLQLIRDGKNFPLPNAQAETAVRKAGKYRLRFANWDQRLTLWVDGSLVFGDGIAVPALPARDRGPTLADLSPAAIGAQNCRVKVRKLELWRDIYYLRGMDENGHRMIDRSLDKVKREELAPSAAALERVEMIHKADDPLTVYEWALHRTRPADWDRWTSDTSGGASRPAFYPRVHPVYHPEDCFGIDEYFVLGDNSPQSADSRDWGQVPERLIMGKAVLVYFPFPPFGTNRLGLIR